MSSTETLNYILPFSVLFMCKVGSWHSWVDAMSSFVMIENY